MTCPHSLHGGDPKSCSQCRGATPKICTIGPNGARLIDGVPLVEADTTTTKKTKASRMKGGSRSKRSREVPQLIEATSVDPDDT